MARNRRKQTSAKKQKGAAKPAEAANKGTANTQSQKDEKEGWGPIGDAAKRVAKGAVKGAAKEISK